MLKKLLIIGILTLALPMAAKALCSWVPTEDCQTVGSSWQKAEKDDVYRPDFCNDTDQNNNKRDEDKTCCCGSNEDIGCCHSQRGASAFVSNQTKCDNVLNDVTKLWSPYPVYYTSGANCVKNDGDCYWVLSATCDSIGSWQDTAGAKCAGKKKLVGTTLKCCCGKDVPNPNATAPTPPADNATPATVVGSVRSDYQTLTNPLGPTDWTLSNLPTIIGRVIKAVLSIIGAIALLIFVYGGFVWMTAAGNEAKVAQGKNILLWATIAIIVMFLSWILVAFMFQALGV